MEASGSLKKTDIVARYHEYKRLWSLHSYPGEYKKPCWKPPESWKWVWTKKNQRESVNSLDKEGSHGTPDGGDSKEKEEPEEPN